MTVYLSGILHCRDAAEVAVVAQYLPEHLRLTRAEAGCLRFDVTVRADGLSWQVDEAFVDQAAFEAHQARGRASIWAEMTAALRRDFRVWHSVDGEAG